MKLKPIFVDTMPDFDLIKPGQLWISLKFRTINLRCPCGCGSLTVLSIHPSRWHVHFDGKTVSLGGPTGGSVWANSGCGSHYLIRNDEVIWAEAINPKSHKQYTMIEHRRLIEYQKSQRNWRSRLKDILRYLTPSNWRR